MAEQSFLGAVYGAIERAKGPFLLVYRGESMISISGMHILSEDAQLLSFDIVRSGIRGLKRIKGKWVADPERGMIAGLSENLIETSVTASQKRHVGHAVRENAWETLEGSGDFYGRSIASYFA